ncbi:helix-turn-helix domain-containing protein [Candidatus Poriferisodalis sp.]|uniref:helix-turn-helix domain-containing protein n=1 Tax=Candidatus Poriferisodalis sp. TaxID=3101277 RepID=UPI003B02979F
MSKSISGSPRQGALRLRLSPRSRLVLVERVAAGRSKTAVAAQMGCSRQAVGKWVKRCEAEGEAGLEDRSSRPARSLGRAPFWRNARDWFNKLNVGIDAVMTDNDRNFTSADFAENRAKHRLARPCRPRTNGKVERFNRTMAEEFLYSHKSRSEPDRRRRLQNWAHTCNHHRHHTAIAATPANHVNNLCGHCMRVMVRGVAALAGMTHHYMPCRGLGDCGGGFLVDAHLPLSNRPGGTYWVQTGRLSQVSS